MKNIVIAQIAFPFITYTVKFYGEAWSNEFCDMLSDIRDKQYSWTDAISILAEYESDEEKETDKDYIILTEFSVYPLYASDDTRTIFKEKGEETMSYST